MSGGEATERWRRIEELFLEALELERDDREARLRSACGEDEVLRREVEAMLAAHIADEPAGIERKLVAEAGAASSDPLVGATVGRYRIVEPIGRGGMGLVYRAERVGDEFEQEVAIKVVRAAWLGSEMLERFGAERQILARLQHPNIAALLDGGVAENGLPYLVMQYVDGVPITRYCDERRLPIAERLALFHQVCEAVAYAHRNLVVHRDLKGSNILVTPEGRVQLLDFGIAKLLDPDAFGLDPALTRTEQRVMTPLNAAPEQLRGEAVTTATDVYALGLLLYELTSGRFAYRLSRASAVEVQKAIHDTSPARLSDAVMSSLPTELAPGRTDHLPAEEIASLRGSRPGVLRRELRGDLERIAFMALRPESERRYESAAQLADDVERYLAGEPVRAHADSFAYRARRFVARHRVATAAAALIALLVTGFTINAQLQARRLRVERDRLAVEQERSEAVLDTLVDLFKSAAPGAAQGDTISLEAFLDSAAATAETMGDRPSVQSRLLFALGEMHAVRGEKATARDFFERAWALEEKIGEGDTLFGQQVFHSLALMNLQLGEVEVGREQMRSSLEWHRRELGEMHTDVAQVMTDLARYLEPPEALPLLQRALEIRREILPEGDMGIASTMNGLAKLHADLGDRPEALALFREVLGMLEAAVGTSHPNYLIVRGYLVSQLPSARERVAIYDELIPVAGPVFGPRSVIVAGYHDYRGLALAEMGELRAGLESCRRGYELAVEAGGETVFQAARAARSQGWIHLVLGDYPAALEWFERAERGMNNDRGRAEAISLQALALLRLDKVGEALEHSRKGLELARASVGDSDSDRVLAGNLGRHGAILISSGKLQPAVAALRTASHMLSSRGGAPREVVAGVEISLGRALLAVGEVEEGTSILRDALERDEGQAMVDPRDLELAGRALESVGG